MVVKGNEVSAHLDCNDPTTKILSTNIPSLYGKEGLVLLGRDFNDNKYEVSKKH